MVEVILKQDFVEYDAVRERQYSVGDRVYGVMNCEMEQYLDPMLQDSKTSEQDTRARSA